MKKLINSFFLLVQFMTRIPIPFKPEYSPKDMAGGFLFAPLIGWIVGAILMGGLKVVNLLGYAPVESFLLLLLYLILTGGLHLDGFADTLDGLAGGGTKERILEIMKDSRSGAFGVIGLIFLLGGKWILLSAPGMMSPLWILTFPVVGRMNVIITAAIGPYARKNGGLGELFVKQTGVKQIIPALIITLAPVILLKFYYFFIPWALTFIYTLLFSFYLRKRLGGVTGDTQGYIIELSEILYLGSAFLLMRLGIFS